MKNVLSAILYTVAALLLATTPGHVSAQTVKGHVYGGGEMSKVDGNTNITINAGQLSGNIFGGGEGLLKNDGTPKASADVSGDTHITIKGGEFRVEDDPLHINPFKEHYNIYGGGNIASAVGNTHLYITKGMVTNDSNGEGDFMTDMDSKAAALYVQKGKMYFCIFGGGYGKNTSVKGDTWVNYHIDGMKDITNLSEDDLLLPEQSYLDVIGGGFNGTVLGNTHVHVGGNAMCRNVYGGGLYATIGTPDDSEKGNTNVHITGGNIDNIYGGGVMGDILTSTNVNIGLKDTFTFDGHDYEVNNDIITILLSVYGGNDVSGHVPQTNILHNGGCIQENLFGAGNGDYIGYYTPGLCDYDEGENNNYYVVDHSGETSTDGKNTIGPKGNTYKGRPQTDNVNITIAGNSDSDRASVLGQVFGGGNSCTVGLWDSALLSTPKYHGDPHLVRDDPAYFLGGGQLNITLGNHVRIGRTHAELDTAWDAEDYLAHGENVSGLYMGCSGRHLATQINEINNNSYHHYYDTKTAKYWPGFAVFADNGTPLSRAEGLASFNAYLNNILVWSDNVRLSIADDVEDVWLANFVGGGFRGSMKAKTASGQFHYSLPRGVTIGHDIVGGAYNTDVVYRVFDTESDMHTYTETDGHYNYCTTIKPEWNEGDDYHHIEYAEDGETITGVIRFYYDGGILSHDDSGSRHQQILQNYNGGNSDALEFAASETNEAGHHALRYHKDKALLYIDARCQLEPEIIDGHVHGGNVFGGCFDSGMVDGDIWTDYRCYIASMWYGNENFNGGSTMFANAQDFQTNFAMMVFGAGYGKNTNIKGDTYVRVIYNKENGKATYPCLYNVFGGSYQGTVDGNSNIYYNAGQQGLTVGAIYGGGCQGYLSGKTFVELAGGYIANVYGGAREANIGEGAHVWAYDGEQRPWGDDLTEHDNAPLVIERMFGGSDVSGLIGFSADATDVTDETKRVPTAGYKAPFSVVNWPEELLLDYDPETTDLEHFNSVTPDGYNLRAFDSYIQIGGETHGDRGYPLVGQIYAGGNGENTDIAQGHVLPGIHTVLIEVNDGNVMEAFGGGNAATIYEQNYILTNSQYPPVSEITMPNAHLTQILQMRVLKDLYDCYTLSGNTFTFRPFHIQRLFGGNNLAMMDIQPKWNLKSGHIGNVYSGGNMGDMTYYNAAAGTPGHESEKKGLTISVASRDIYINNLFGGCRLADVDAGTDMEGEDDSDRYGANVIITDGHIENVYGGNDVSGTVRNGTHVYINGAISGNVYGAGNGDYVYVYDTSDEPVTQMREMFDAENRYSYYLVPPTYPAATTDVEKLRHINRLRPNAERSYLHLEGTETRQAYVKGDVYAGGNSASVTGADEEHIDVRFNIGSYVTLNGVYLGSNGANLTHTDYLDRLFAKNKITSITTELLDELMKAVDLTAMPKGFDNFGERQLINANIGVFCLGGNAGSMTTQKHITLDFPSDLVIYNRIVGGCNNTDFTYKGVAHKGGFTGILADDQGTTKVTLNVGCKFIPQYMHIDTIPETGYETTASLRYKLGTNGGMDIFAERRCNVYGGCFTSGKMIGDIEINVTSDMLGSIINADGTGKSFGDTGKNGLDLLKNTNYLKYTSTKSQANVPYVFSVFGGGYGANTSVEGNVHITMPHATDGEGNVLMPRVNTLYGGSEQGLVVGNTTMEVRNGTVFNSIFGGSDAARLYGSSQIIVGYPDYYRCNTSGRYEFTRSDKSADNLSYNSVDHVGHKVICTEAYYREADLIAQNVYETLSTDAQRSNFTLVTDVTPQWDGTQIKIGSGIYGGGFSSSYGAEQSAGTYTICTFTDEYTPDETAIGYGGNATIMVADDAETEHIVISERPAGVTNTSKNVLGEGGIFGCGHLVFTQGFKAADIKNYGYANHTVENPLSLNTFQRLDLLTVRDCCMQLWGARDFAVNKVDARAFSMARVIELNMQSSIDPGTALAGLDTPKSRNYVCMMNNVYNFGALVTNDAFETATYHNNDGTVGAGTYQSVKMDNINANRGYDDRLAIFKQRNVGTARNLMGINNGYSLKIQNAYSNAGTETFYYGPVIGVAEIKLLSYQQGEGGGYVYADNLHTYAGTDNERFLQRQGNLVFPGTVDDNYIVDDCFPTFYHTGQDSGDEAPAHYWFVEGSKYFFTTVLTGYTYRQEKTFHLDNEDGIVQLSGLGTGQPVALESVWWKSAGSNDTGGYSADLRDGGKDYSFTIKVGGEAFSIGMPRTDTNITDTSTEWGAPITPVDLDGEGLSTYDSVQLPAFDLVLTDREDNSGEDYYYDHMAKPEEVLIVMKGRDGLGKECTYYITTIIHYLQGPQVDGDLAVGNCALPGELIHVTDENITVSGDAEMIITNLKWKLLPYHADTDSYSTPDDDDCIDIDGYRDASLRNLYIPALYAQNSYKVAFTFQAMGESFSYTGSDDEGSKLLVHNYHRMKDVETYNLDPKAGARVYIQDEADLLAFMQWINGGNTTEGIDFVLQSCLTLPQTWSLSEAFLGTLHGDGYVLTAPQGVTTLFGSNLSGKVYNLGMVGAEIAQGGYTGNVTNSYVYQPTATFTYGKMAYELSHAFNPTTDHEDYDDYVARYYANGDYQYARHTEAWSLRTAESPNYGSTETHHQTAHTHDALRWDELEAVNVPLYDASTDAYNSDYLFFGQHLDKDNADAYPVHICSIAHGDTDESRGGNRVYETAGYYQSTTNSGFYYNMDAWALQPTLTAIDYTHMTTELDQAATLPEAFDVDSNRDAVLTYDNETEGHVTQNLLVYNAGQAVFEYTDTDGSQESDVLYHNIADAGSGFVTSYLHLVDKQDFWCPIPFTVTERAWYERIPQTWRTIATSADYPYGNAWEGIALPFTVREVKGEETGNTLSHFYGAVPVDATPNTNDRTLHHEYWLAGMVEAGAEHVTFARPAVSGEGLYTQAGQVSGNYVYENSYYRTLPDYYNHYTTRDDAEWYAQAHTFADYVYQTGNMPYLIAFPGDSFYEFDVTGQVITFEGGASTAIPVTVEGQSVVSDAIHSASFIHRSEATSVNDTGTAFVDSGETDYVPVLPFRTFLAHASAPARRYAITDGIEEVMPNDGEPTENEPQCIEVHAEGADLVITSTLSTCLPVYTINGMLVRRLQVAPGTSRHTMHPGIYIVHGRKYVCS